MLDSEMYNGWSCVISTIVLTAICSSFSFVICTKKSSKRTSSVISNIDEQEMPPEPSFHDRTSYPTTTYHASNPQEDFVKNPKKTELIRKGLLKTHKKNPNYDTLADIDREMSLRQMDMGQKSEPVREHIYEKLGSDIMNMTQQVVDGKTVIEPVLRRDSIPKRESSKVVILTKAPPVTDIKQQTGGDSTQKLSLVPKIIVDVKPSRRSLICRASSKTANNRKPSVDTKVAEKPNVVGEKSVKGAPLGVKASKILVGEKSVKPAPPVVVKNMWDAAAKS